MGDAPENEEDDSSLQVVVFGAHLVLIVLAGVFALVNFLACLSAKRRLRLQPHPSAPSFCFALAPLPIPTTRLVYPIKRHLEIGNRITS
ncbi:unnamed protein product, partial [Mesorhabditis spiculigera]